MKKWGNNLIIALITSYLIRQLFDVLILDYVNAFLTTIIIIFTLIYSKKLPSIFSIVMVLSGTFILFYVDPTWSFFMESVTKNLPLICLIIVVPILSVPIHLGNYHKSIEVFLDKFSHKPSILYMIIYSFFYILTPITNLGSVHIIHSMISQMKFPSDFLGRLYPRAFTSINTWAPYFASVFLVVYYLEIPLYKFVPYGLLLSFFQFLTAASLFAFKEKHHIHIDEVVIEQNKKSDWLAEFLIAIFLLIGIIFVIEPYIQLDVSVLIIFVAVIFSIVWAVYLKNLNGFAKSVKEFKDNIIAKQSNEVALFLTAGFFGVILAASPISDYVNDAWRLIANQSFVLLVLLTIIIVSLFSFIGIHQIVIISSILASVSPATLGIHDRIFAMILLSAWAIGSVVSPIAPVNVIVSNIMSLNVFKMIFSMNFLYACILTVVHTFVIYITYLII